MTSALFDPKREKIRDWGRAISAAYPVRHDTPVDMIKLLERIG